MALKFRRTLSMEDLQNASDEEMDDLLSSGGGPHSSTTNLLQDLESSSAGTNKHDKFRTDTNVPADPDDFFLNGPEAPILNLDSDFSPEKNGDSSSQGIPRSKSVRFQEPDGSIGNDKIKQVRVQVEEVTGVMRDNVTRLLDREANLDSLADLSEQLHHSSDIYRQSSDLLRRKMWWRQQRTRFVLTAVIIICIFFLFIPIISKLV